MNLNKVRTTIELARTELMGTFRSSKMIIFAVFFIFINIQVIEPLSGMARDMDMKMSFLEPFIAIGNSGMVVLLLPVLYLTIMADFPREGASQYYYHIRSDKKMWITGQLLYAFLFSAAIVLIVGVASALFLIGKEELSFSYSDCITKYVMTFPDRAGDYASNLITENVYNQETLSAAVLLTASLLFLYLFTLSLILLLSYVLGQKLLGIIINVVIVTLGTVTCAVGSSGKWIFPMSHSIFWLHFTEYTSRPVFPLAGSYFYFIVIDTVMIVLVYLLSKRIKVG